MRGYHYSWLENNGTGFASSVVVSNMVASRLFFFYLWWGHKKLSAVIIFSNFLELHNYHNFFDKKK